jgi:hypothetical protein
MPKGVSPHTDKGLIPNLLISVNDIKRLDLSVEIL